MSTGLQGVLEPTQAQRIMGLFIEIVIDYIHQPGTLVEASPDQEIDDALEI
jgi:hypothetical protein